MRCFPRRPLLALLAGLALGALLGGPRAAPAHDEGAAARREIVRLQGRRLADGDPTGPGDVEISVLGRRSRLRPGDLRVFTSVAPAAPAAAPGSAGPAPGATAASDAAATLRSVTLQGERADLTRLNGSRPDQRVTILAERRPGSSELFVLALDLCPEQ